jgi:peptidoglycan/xylan/chitin deacetylase (PgdA/CDA1 family)
MNQKDRSRRAVLGMGTAALAGLAGCGVGNDADEALGVREETEDDGTDDAATDGETSDEEREEVPELPENGAVVFVYDDGPMEDYTQAFPAHREFDAPATTGIVSEWIGREGFMGHDWMDVEHLAELEEAGWEIASHTTEHTAVGTFELVENADPGDERVYNGSNRHGFWAPRELEITDGERTVRRTALGWDEDDTGRYVELDEPLGESFAAGEAVTRYPEEAIREALGESRRELERLGFEVDTFLAPYDSFDDYSRRFATEYYDGVANARHGSRVNDPEGFDPYYTRRDYFIEFTSRESVKRDLDEIAARGALGVIGAHAFKEEVSEERIRETLEWIDDRDIEVMTLREAIARFGADRP